jgi:UDP-N-acetylmuramoylalanine--D-glutamate ligase
VTRNDGPPGRLVGLTHGRADWAGLRVVVAGLGRSGFAAADALVERGADVLVVDARSGEGERERAMILEVLGGTVRLGAGEAQTLPDVAGQVPDLVVAPDRRAPDPLLAAAAAAGVPVWGEAELAWRMRPATGAAPWLTIAGSNGRTTTVRMLAAMLAAAGERAVAVGGDDAPVLEAVLHPRPYDVLAVELSTTQLRRMSSPGPQASVCLNVASPPAGGLGRVYENTEIACVYNVADPVTEQLVRDADVVEGCRAVGFTLAVPGVSMVGVVEDVLADRAFVPERRTSAAELGTLDDVRTASGGMLAPHLVADALAAAALARAHGVRPAAVRDGLRGVRPQPHHLTRVAEAGGVVWVDDSAAADPHAAGAALAAFDRVVWVAGGGVGGAWGARFDDLVAGHAARLRAVVLLGADRARIAGAIARHAPDVPVVTVDVADTGPVELMDAVVARARDLARPGDTVLLAPGCAAGDRFDSPAHRGEAFAAAVHRVTGPSAGPGEG